MKKNKSSISKSNSYETMGNFWDSHDLTDFVSHTKKVNFNVDIKSEKIYCSLNKNISNELQILANKQGISPDMLVNKILQEKLKTMKSTKKLN